jgi:small subunit ribosomal protein S8
MNATGDPITDLLNRLRNAMRAGHDRADIPASRVKENLLKVLAEEGYVVSYRRVEEKGRPLLRVGLKYDPDGEPVVNGFERVSRPGRRVYAPAKEIPEVLGGLGTRDRVRLRDVVDQPVAARRSPARDFCNVWQL